MAGLFALGGGIGALGSLLGGITSLFAGNEQKTAEEHAALQASQEAGVNAQLKLMQGDAAAAHGAVAAAANGGGLVGSSMGAISQLSQQALYNARATVYSGEVERQRDLYNAQVAKVQGEMGLVSGVVGAGSSLMGGFMKADLFKQAQQAAAASKGDPSAAYMLGSF